MTVACDNAHPRPHLAYELIISLQILECEVPRLNATICGQALCYPQREVEARWYDLAHIPLEGKAWAFLTAGNYLAGRYFLGIEQAEVPNHDATRSSAVMWIRVCASCYRDVGSFPFTEGRISPSSIRSREHLLIYCLP